MLYISSIAGRDKWRVTDTDDGDVTAVSLASLKNIVQKLAQFCQIAPAHKPQGIPYPCPA